MQMSWRRGLVASGLVAIGLLTVSGSAARAQPSDAQIIRDLKSPGVISVKLLGRGSRVWSTGYSQYTWDRTAIVVRKAGLREFPNARVEIGGIATYSIVGGRFPFKKFYVGYNSYIGIPAPSAKTIVALLKTDMSIFLGNDALFIVGPVQPIALASNPKWNWHTPNSVSLRVTTGYKKKVSYTELEQQKVVKEVRLYRNAIKSPWNRFASSLESSTPSGRTTHDADALRVMKTFSTVEAERGAARRLASLPQVSVPAFKTDLQMFAFLHNTLREGNAAKTEAVLRRALAPAFFVEGSEVLLNGDGDLLLNRVIDQAHKGKMTYAEQFAPDLNVDHYKANELSFWNADGVHRSSIELEMTGGSWQNGAKVGQVFKLKQLDVYGVTGADEAARLRSMSPASRFAPPPRSQRFSTLGGQVAAQQNAQNAAADVRAIKWTPFISNNARLKMSFPAKPTETQSQMNGQYPMWTVEASNDLVLCRAVAVIYPKFLNRMQSQTLVNSAMQELVSSNGMSIKISSDLTGGTVGKIATLQKDGTVMKVRVYALGNVLYQLVLSGSPATMNVVKDNEFFNSFEALR